MSVLIGVLLPALAGAKRSAMAIRCGSNLRQLGVGIALYWSDYDRTLPQARGEVPGFGPAIIGALFGGKRGTLPFYGINELGAERRPLNRYVLGFDPPPDDSGTDIELEVFRSPLDRGAGHTGIAIPGLERTDSMYDLVGSSYTLNDHAPDDDPIVERWRTLLPPVGGRMPHVIDPSRTWVLGTHTMYAFDDGGDRRMRWFESSRERANLLFLDLHVRASIMIDGASHKTPDYTFLPRPDWISRYPW